MDHQVVNHSIGKFLALLTELDRDKHLSLYNAYDRKMFPNIDTRMPEFWQPDVGFLDFFLQSVQNDICVT